MDILDTILAVYVALLLHTLTIGALTNDGRRSVADGLQAMFPFFGKNHETPVYRLVESPNPRHPRHPTQHPLMYEDYHPMHEGYEGYQGEEPYEKYEEYNPIYGDEGHRGHSETREMYRDHVSYMDVQKAVDIQALQQQQQRTQQQTFATRAVETFQPAWQDEDDGYGSILGTGEGATATMTSRS